MTAPVTMRAFLWMAIALGALLLSARVALRGSARKGPQQFLSGLAFALCSLFFGMMTQRDPPLGSLFWTRLFWSTLLLAVPIWVGSSHRFGRPAGVGPGSLQRLLLIALWISGSALLVAGHIEAPLQVRPLPDGRFSLTPGPPFGRWLTVQTLLGVVLLLWNLHATLEAARGARKRDTAGVVYAALPVILIGLYTMAEFLLYGQVVTPPAGDILLGSTAASLGIWALVFRRRSYSDLDIPVGYPVEPSPSVLGALGVFFVGLAVIAETIRRLGATGPMTPYQQAGLAFFVIVIALWILPGLRQEIGRWIAKGIPRLPGEEPALREAVRLATLAAENPSDLLASLRILLRTKTGDLRLELWIRTSLVEDYAQVTASERHNLGSEHPLVTEMRTAAEPLLLSRDAERIDEIPLWSACMELERLHGVRVFQAVRCQGQLVAILGYGPEGSTRLHPEEIQLIRDLSDHLGTAVARWTGEPSAGMLPAASLARSESTTPRGREEVALEPWLHAIGSRARESFPKLPRLRLRLAGPPRVVLDTSILAPALRHLIGGASLSLPAAEEEMEVGVETDGETMKIRFGSDGEPIALRLALDRDPRDQG